MGDPRGTQVKGGAKLLGLGGGDRRALLMLCRVHHSMVHEKNTGWRISIVTIYVPKRGKMMARIQERGGRLETGQLGEAETV